MTPQNETPKTKPKKRLGVNKNEKRNSKNEAEQKLGVSTIEERKHQNENEKRSHHPES